MIFVLKIPPMEAPGLVCRCRSPLIEQAVRIVNLGRRPTYESSASVQNIYRIRHPHENQQTFFSVNGNPFGERKKEKNILGERIVKERLLRLNGRPRPVAL